MFDKLRRQSTEATPEGEEAAAEPTPARRALRLPSVRMPASPISLGLTPPQRFLLVLMLFLNVSVLGCFALVAFEKIALPF